MAPTTLRDELRAARRAVEEAQAHVRTLRARAAGSRVALRLETDVRRVVEDLDDLDAETSAGAVEGTTNGMESRTDYLDHGVTEREPVAEREPVPVPPRQGEPEFQPECDDEGLGGGWHAETTTYDPGRRRRTPARGHGRGSTTGNTGSGNTGNTGTTGSGRTR